MSDTNGDAANGKHITRKCVGHSEILLVGKHVAALGPTSAKTIDEVVQELQAIVHPHVNRSHVELAAEAYGVTLADTVPDVPQLLQKINELETRLGVVEEWMADSLPSGDGRIPQHLFR